MAEAFKPGPGPAIEALIARYRAVNGFVASDGYHDRDEGEVIAVATAEATALRQAAWELVMATNPGAELGVAELPSERVSRLQGLLLGREAAQRAAYEESLAGGTK